MRSRSPIRREARLLAGRAAEQLLALAAAERVDLLVTGTRPLRGPARWLAPRLRHELLAGARCPVVLVRRAPRTALGAVVAVGSPQVLRLASTLAGSLGTHVVCGHPGELAEPPLLVVVGRERAHGLRRRLKRSPADALVEAAHCPVVVANR